MKTSSLAATMAAAMTGALAAVGLSTPARAHHSFALFDLSRALEAQATVESFQWTQPHVWLDVTLPGPGGAPTTVPLQCMDTATLSRRGWSRDSLKPGETVKVSYFANRNGMPGGALRIVTLPDGTMLYAYDFPVQPAGG